MMNEDDFVIPRKIVELPNMTIEELKRHHKIFLGWKEAHNFKSFKEIPEDELQEFISFIEDIHAEITKNKATNSKGKQWLIYI